MQKAGFLTTGLIPSWDLNNKCADQTVLMRRLICDFVVPRGLKQVSDHKVHLKVIFMIPSIGITCEN